MSTTYKCKLQEQDGEKFKEWSIWKNALAFSTMLIIYQLVIFFVVYGLMKIKTRNTKPYNNKKISKATVKESS